MAMVCDALPHFVIVGSGVCHEQYVVTAQFCGQLLSEAAFPATNAAEDKLHGAVSLRSKVVVGL